MLASQLQAYLDQCLAGPVLPATLLMVAVVLYGGLVLLGTVDFDVIDFDLDVDNDIDVTSVGFVTLKFLNIGEVPLMIWLCVFALCWWVVSQMLWVWWDEAGYLPGALAAGRLSLRNAAVAVLLTKFCTDPLAKVFAKPVHLLPQDLIGRICTITTFEATPESGQASYQTEAAPLLMNVRTREGTFRKGDRAMITAYDAEAKIYLVEPAPPDRLA